MLKRGEELFQDFVNSKPGYEDLRWAKCADLKEDCEFYQFPDQMFLFY
jgi:hypothetical protein